MTRVDSGMVRDTGFEPVTPSVSGRCSTTELTALYRLFTACAKHLVLNFRLANGVASS